MSLEEAISVYVQDGDLVGNFTTDENGSYSYTQDLETYHYIDIQESISTIYINADGSIDPPGAPISRSGETYTLTGNINEPIWIKRSGITFDGNGFNLQGMYYNVGVASEEWLDEYFDKDYSESLG